VTDAAVLAFSPRRWLFKYRAFGAAKGHAAGRAA
jgi:hypothetical protein